MEVGGAPVDLVTRRTGALLAHLACVAAPQSRSLLAGMFWPDRPERRARGNLRVLLSNLRSAVGPLLDIQRDTVAFVPAYRKLVDVHRFDGLADRALARAGAAPDPDLLEAALAEYGGELLAGFDFAAGVAFDGWLTAERTRLHLRAVQVLEVLVDLHLPGADTSRAVVLAHRLQGLDPWRESSQERLMRAQWCAGDRTGALHSYERWARGLEAEVGIAVSERLRALEEEIRRGDGPPVDGRIVWRLSGPPDAGRGAGAVEADVAGASRLRTPDWPFVARDAELAMLAGVVAASSSGATPAGAVIVGPAGTGRTRLLREVQGWSRGHGHETAWIPGTHAATAMPFAAIASLAPDVDPAAQPDVASLHRAYTASIVGRTAGSRLVVLVDDAHLLDDGTAALLLQLVASEVATVVASVPPGLPDDNPMTRLWKDGWAVRIDLAPLSAEAMGELLAAGLGGVVDATARQGLVEIADGNPLYLRELVLGAIEAGSLREIDGCWRWDGQVVLAQRLVDAVEWRLHGLSSGERQVLAIVALGEPVGLDLLERLTEGTAIAEMEGRGLLTIVRDDRRLQVRLGHPLCGEVVVDRMGEAGRRSVLRLLADHLETTGANRPGDHVRVATWRLDAGAPSGPEEMTAAAVAANDVFDHELAWRLARAAVEGGGDHRAVLAMAAAGNATSRPTEVEAALAARADDLQAHEDPTVVRAYLFHRFQALHFGLGHINATLALLDDVGSRPSGSDLGVLLDAYRTQVTRDTGRARQALVHGTAVLDAPVVDAAALELVEGSVLAACFDLGRTQRARDLASRLRERRSDGSPAGMRHAALWATLQEMVCLSQEGRVAEAIPMVEPVHRQVVAGPERSQRGVVGTLLGQCHLQRGTVRAAREVLTASVAALEDADVMGGRSLALAMLAQAEALSGDLAAAERTQATAHAHAGGRHRTRFAVDMAAMDVWVAAAAGPRAAASQLAMAAARGMGDERPGAEARLRHLALRLGGDPAPVAARLDELTRETDNPLLEMYRDHARALSGDDAAGLDVVAEAFEQYGLWSLAVEAAGQAASAHRRAGDEAAARRSEEHCAELGARCDADLLADATARDT